MRVRVIQMVCGALITLVLSTAGSQARTWTGQTFVDQEAAGAALVSVACPISGVCLAIDSGRRLVSFDPAAPSGARSVRLGGTSADQQGDLVALACPSASQCTAVGRLGDELTFDPASIGTPQPIQILHPTGSAVIENAACASTARCTMVDNRGEVLTFDPQAPGLADAVQIDTADDTADGVGLIAIACPSDTQCTAVGAGGKEWTFNPASPGVPVSADLGVHGAIACPSATQCTVVGGPGQEVTFDPILPLLPAPVTIDDNGLSGIACPSITQCTAVDLNRNQVTFNPASAGTPTPVAIEPGYAALNAVACVSAQACVAVGRQGQEVAFTPAGGAQPPAVIDHVGDSQALACPTIEECTSVDDSGQEVTFDPATPAATTSRIVDPTASALVDVACPAAGQCTAVDGQGAEVTFDPASADSTSAIIDPGQALVAIACPTTAQCTAIDNADAAVTFDPGAPGATAARTVVDSGSHVAVTAIACPSAAQCTVVDNVGNQVTFDPSHPGSPTPDPIGAGIGDGLRAGLNPLGAVACPSEAQCTGVVTDGFAETFNPFSSGAQNGSESVLGAAATAVACPSVSDCVVLDGASDVDEGSPIASGWTSKIPLPGVSPFRGHVSCPSLTLCVVVDNSGDAYVGNGPPPVGDPTTTTVTCLPAIQYTFSSCTATVTDTAPTGASTPTGNVVFSSPSSTVTVDRGSSCSLTAPSTPGVASCTLEAESGTPGTYTLAASFQGDGRHQASSSTVSFSVTASSTGTPPRNTTPPTITGATVVGGKLTAASGTWTGLPSVRYLYQWRACTKTCADISGATAPTFTPTTGQQGDRLEVVVTDITAGGSASAVSAEVGPVGVSGPAARSELAVVLRAAGVPRRVKQLITRGQATVPVHAQFSGELQIRYQAANARHGHSSVLLAIGSVRLTKPGLTSLTLRLTPVGRRQLSRRHTLRTTAVGSFTPIGCAPVRITAPRTL